MVYARHPVGCHDIRHSRIKERTERRHYSNQPRSTVDKARLLESFGWQVHITDSVGRQFGVSEFYLKITIERCQ